jgi:hypothetical protein
MSGFVPAKRGAVTLVRKLAHSLGRVRSGPEGGK